MVVPLAQNETKLMILHKQSNFSCLHGSVSRTLCSSDLSPQYMLYIVKVVLVCQHCILNSSRLDQLSCKVHLVWEDSVAGMGFKESVVGHSVVFLLGWFLGDGRSCISIQQFPINRLSKLEVRKMHFVGIELWSQSYRLVGCVFRGHHSPTQ